MGSVASLRSTPRWRGWMPAPKRCELDGTCAPPQKGHSEFRQESYRNDARLIAKRFQDVQSVAIAEFHIDHCGILALPVLTVLAGGLPDIFIVILRRRPEIEHHFTTGSSDFDACRIEFNDLSDNHRVPRD